MAEDEIKKLRLRIRLKSGEEFEAEGDAAFISRQKEAFLTLIGNKEDGQTQITPKATYGGPVFTPTPSNISRQVLPSYIKNAARRQEQEPNKAYVPMPVRDVWDKTAYTDGEDIVMRRKDKNIKSSSAALIILGAAKVLKNQDGLSALELSKSLKLSGYLKGDTRLDRAISAEIKEAYIIFEGSKRNRLYRLTQKGLAKAFTTAEKAILDEEKKNLI